MAELSIFHYLPHRTLLHQLDSRVKLSCMVLYSIAIGFAKTTWALSILTLIIMVLLYLAKLPAFKLLREMRFFLFFILFIVVVHALRSPGTPLWVLSGMVVTWEGLVSGVFYGWRIILLLFLSFILTGTTTLSALRAGVEDLLEPIPFLPAVKLGTMFSLVIVFIPLLLDKAAEMDEAEKARCVEGRKNPIKRLTYLVYPYLYHTFLYAEEVVTAMEARCYTGQKTKPALALTALDWLCLTCTIIILILVFC